MLATSSLWIPLGAIFVFADSLIHLALSSLVCKYITSMFMIHSAFYMCWILHFILLLLTLVLPSSKLCISLIDHG